MKINDKSRRCTLTTNLHPSQWCLGATRITRFNEKWDLCDSSFSFMYKWIKVLNKIYFLTKSGRFETQLHAWSYILILWCIINLHYCRKHPKLWLLRVTFLEVKSKIDESNSLMPDIWACYARPYPKYEQHIRICSSY